MSVRIGINPITWTNDDFPELGGDTPLETCLAETREAGYLGTELGGKFPRESGGARQAPRAATTSPWSPAGGTGASSSARWRQSSRRSSRT